MLHNYVATDRQMYEQAWFVLSACQLNTTPGISFLDKFVFFKKTPCCIMCLEMLLNDICYAGSLLRKEGRGRKGNSKGRAAFWARNIHFNRTDIWLPVFTVAVYDHIDNENTVAEGVLHWCLRHDSYCPTASKLTLAKSLAFCQSIHNCTAPHLQLGGLRAPAPAPCLCHLQYYTSLCLASGPQTQGLDSLAHQPGTLRK